MSRHFVILGAGISGLATAWFLKERLNSSDRLTILEKSNRAGGWIETIKKNNFLFELGPRSCRTNGNGLETLKLIEALNIHDEVIAPSPLANRRYIAHNDQLKPLPNNLWQIPFNALTYDWWKALYFDLTQPKRSAQDESIESFFTRRLGKNWTEKIIDPFVVGIYAGNYKHLSLKSCFPVFDNWEQTTGSLLKGCWSHKSNKMQNVSSFVNQMQKKPLFSFKHGMQSLTDCLKDRLIDHLHLNSPVESMVRVGNQININFNDSETLIADHVISTLSIPDLALISLTDAPTIESIPYASVAVVCLGFNSLQFSLNGFGYLRPSSSTSAILGCVWDSCVFPEQNISSSQVRLTFMLGGTKKNEMIKFLSDQQLIDLCLNELKSLCKIQSKPDCQIIKRTFMAIPQYEVGYEQWKDNLLNEFKKHIPQVITSGSAISGVSVNDCIAYAKQLVAKNF